VSQKIPTGPRQLEFSFDAPPAEVAPPAPTPAAGRRPRLRVIQGGGQREREKLASRDAVVRVLLEAGADLLLRRISSVRAEEIERQVEAILALFDRVDQDPRRMPELQRRLEDLESLMTETRALKPAR
jgi:hypothetical protein